MEWGSWCCWEEETSWPLGSRARMQPLLLGEELLGPDRSLFRQRGWGPSVVSRHLCWLHHNVKVILFRKNYSDFMINWILGSVWDRERRFRNYSEVYTLTNWVYDDFINWDKGNGGRKALWAAGGGCVHACLYRVWGIYDKFIWEKWKLGTIDLEVRCSGYTRN